jgi:secreted PhoX family phosphatase
VLSNPDNIGVSPRGGIVLCEDGSGVQFLHGLHQR